MLLLATLCCLQALLLALAIVFAQVAAGRAVLDADAPRAQVVASVPSGWRAGARITREGEDVRVSLRAPAVLPGTGRWLEVSATSEAAP